MSEGKTQAALGLAHQALEAASAVADQVAILQVLGRINWQMGRGSDARDAFNAAFERALSSPAIDPRVLVVTADNAGLGEYYFGDRARALDLRRQAVDLSLSRTPENIDGLRRLRRRLAASLAEAGLFQDAEAMYDEARPDPADPVDEHVSWNTSVALLHETRGDLGRALTYFMDVVGLLENAPEAEGYAAALGNAIATQIELGQIIDVAPLVRRLHRAVRDDQRVASQLALSDVRVSYLEARGRFGAAARVAIRGCARVEREVGASHPRALVRVAQVLGLYRKGGDLASRQALLDARQDLALEDDLDTAAFLLEAARYRLEQDETDTATELGHRALYLGAVHGNAGMLSAVFSILGDVYAHLSRPFAADVFGKMAVSVIRDMVATIDGAEAAAWMSERQDAYGKVLNRLAARGRVGEASRLVLRQLQETSGFFARRTAGPGTPLAPVPFGDKEKPLIDAFEALLTDAAGGHKEDARLERVRKDVAQWIDKVLSVPDTHLEHADAQPEDAPPDGVAYLTAILSGNRLLLRLRRAGACLEQVHDTDLDGLGAEVLALRHAMEDQSASWRVASTALYRRLIAPLEGALDGITRIYVATSGVLSFVSFASLFDGQRFLVERVEIAYLTGQNGVSRPARKGQKIAGFAADTFTADQGDRLGASADLAFIRQNAGTAVHIGEGFTTDALVGALKDGATVLHLATHFLHDPARPALSALCLGDGGRLTATEFAGPEFDLSKVDLVMLAACETGTADGLDQGLLGFAGLAQQKGACQVGATLWAIADKATTKLMQAFYQSYLSDEGQSAITALAMAQRQLIDSKASGPADRRRGGIGHSSPAAKTPHPGRWAGFSIFVGQPDAAWQISSEKSC